MFVCQIWISLLFNLSLYSYLLQFYFGRPELLDSGRNSWKLDSGRWTVDVGLWTLDSESWTLDAGLWTLDSGHLTMESGRWTLDPVLWTLDDTLWTLGSGHWTLSLFLSEQNQNPISDSAWLNYWKFFGCEFLRTSGLACFVETIGSDVAIFRNSMLTLSVTL